MDDLISRQAAIDTIGTWDKFGVDERGRIVRWHEGLELYVHLRDVFTAIVNLPSVQPEEASMILGTSKDGVRLWYKCSVCGEPANADDNYCCNCGRKFINE